MSKGNAVKEKSLFNADEIATLISRAISVDLSPSTQVYGRMSPGQQFAADRQREEILKKFLFSDTDEDVLRRQAFAKFRKVNDYVGRIDRKENFPYHMSIPQSYASYRDNVHLRARDICRYVLGRFSMENWFNHCKNSSGASIGVPYRDTSEEAKSKYPLSVTQGAKPIFEEYLAYNRMLRVALEELNKGPEVERYLVVNGSTATTVEKDSTKRRFIAKEPTANMYLQQGLMHMMYDRLEKVGLSVESLPEAHKVLAQESSLSGKNATVDWTSASDSVGYELVKWCLSTSGDWFDAIDSVRCSYTNINGQWVPLNMFSSMGNAVTFPLETLIFWAYGQAVRMSENTKTNTMLLEEEDYRKVSVFGDDCIIDSSYASKFIDVMEGIGFEVNSEKSFLGSVRFRESCGGDYFAGFPVRPYNLKAPADMRLSSLEPWLCKILNSLIPKYIMYFGERDYLYGKELWCVISRVMRKYGLMLRPVPSNYPDDAGFLGEDLGRFALTYGLTTHAVYVNRHGLKSFSYNRFQYWSERTERDDLLRLAIWLKKPVLSKRKPIRWNLPRDKGGYVVGKGYTGCDALSS